MSPATHLGGVELSECGPWAGKGPSRGLLRSRPGPRPSGAGSGRPARRTSSSECRRRRDVPGASRPPWRRPALPLPARLVVTFRRPQRRLGRALRRPPAAPLYENWSTASADPHRVGHAFEGSDEGATADGHDEYFEGDEVTL